MKKCAGLVFLSVLYLALLFTLSACSSSGSELPSDQWTETTACIIATNGDSLLLYQQEPGLFYISLNEVQVSGPEGQPLSRTDLANLTDGRMIRFASNGINDLLYPAKYDTNGKAQLLDETNPELYAAGQQAAREHLQDPV